MISRILHPLRFDSQSELFVTKNLGLYSLFFTISFLLYLLVNHPIGLSLDRLRELLNLTATIDPGGDSLCSRQSTLRGPHQKIVSYSLYGHFRNRAIGPYEKLLFKIPASVKIWYPGIMELIFQSLNTSSIISILEKLCNSSIVLTGWVVRIYTNYSTVDEDITAWMDAIKDRYPFVDFCHVTSLPGLSEDIQRNQSNGRVWRFLPMMDPLVDVFVSRSARIHSASCAAG